MMMMMMTLLAQYTADIADDRNLCKFVLAATLCAKVLIMTAGASKVSLLWQACSYFVTDEPTTFERLSLVQLTWLAFIVKSYSL